MRLADLFWNLFVRTGSVTAYLLYKRFPSAGAQELSTG